MYDLLFNVPWWIPAVLGITGITLMVRGNSQQNERVRTGGAAVLLLGVGWAVMSYLIDTPKETCIKQSRILVRTVVARDWTAFDALLDPNVHFSFEGDSWSIDGKDRLDAAIRADIEKVGVTSASVSNITAEDRSAITTRFTVLSVQESTLGRPLTSSWQFEWRKSSSGRWLLTEIRGIRVGDVDVKEIKGALPVR